jgi:uncharacterized membrane-anchored protein
MGEVVNLRLARKAKARADKEAEAAENRIRFGQTKQQRLVNKAIERIDGKRLDGHKLTTDPEIK